MAEEDEKSLKNSILQQKRRQLDLDDLSNEIADRDVGRIRRFLPEESSHHAQREKRKREAERLSQLMLMMQDPEYATLRNDAIDKLRRYELAAERALEDAIARGDQTEIDAIRKYQVEVLGHARDRLYEEDDAATKNELRNIDSRFRDKAPSMVIEHYDAENVTKAEPSHVSALAAPILPK
mgnify:CR=1 FL=1